MKKFRELPYSSLIDLLAIYTAQYTQLLSGNMRNDEFYRCKRIIEQLTAEIGSRKKPGSNHHRSMRPHKPDLPRTGK